MAESEVAGPVGVRASVERRVRWIAVRGLAAVLVGGLVLGVGGRLVMFASRLLHPDTVGRTTSNGNVIGEFTVGGTVALVLFGGVLGGAVAGVVWTLVRQWLPDKVWVTALVTLAIGGTSLVRGDDRDFVVLAPATVDVALLLALMALFGVVLHVTDRALEARLPAVRSDSMLAGYASVVLLGLPILLLTALQFSTREICACHRPQYETAAGLALAGLATAWWWFDDARGAREPAVRVRLLGRAGVVLAVVSGVVALARQVALAL